MDYIIALDIGGTTFRSGLYTADLKEIKLSNKDKIRNYSDKNKVINAIINQIQLLIDDEKINNNQILGLGISLPGPLNIEKGFILKTPNLKVFQNYNIVDDFKSKLNIKVFIDNDANLFTLGEWYLNYRNSNIVFGLTIGTGLGTGLVLDGKIYKGGSGNAMEYGISPFKWGQCEVNTSIRYIRKRSKEIYGKEISPVIIENYFNNNDKDAIKIYNEFGENLGIVLSHIINLIDPQIITIGGGLSKAFDCFKKHMFKTIKNNSLTYNENNIIISPSSSSVRSAMLGASLMVKKLIK